MGELMMDLDYELLAKVCGWISNGDSFPVSGEIIFSFFVWFGLGIM
jgi:hypothetical protein